MAQVRANGLDIEYDTFGDSDADPILLIMGLGSQMVAWPRDFCRALAEGGHFVVRFDNRDVGLSTKFDGVKAPGPIRFLLNRIFGLRLRAPYTLDDMAGDAVGVLDALGLGQAHVVGASMGGMIAQIMAASHPSRVKTLASIMSSSGDPDLPTARREVTKQLTRRPKSTDRDALVPHLVKSLRVILSPGYPRSDEELKALIVESLDRSTYPEGLARQVAAIVADGSRVERLSTINAPTLVIHGKEDPLIPVLCGFSTALHIRGAKLELIDGMGHDLPTPLLAPLASMIVRHISESEAMSEKRDEPAAPSGESPSESSETAGILVPPPVPLLAALVLGLVLDYVVPADLPFEAPLWTRSIGAVAGIVAGALLIASAFRLFRRVGVNADPYRPTSGIISSGPYQYSRNPMYVGLILIYAGLAALFGGPWCWLLLPVAVLVLHFGVVRREEAYLERRFGDAFRDYCARVRRWL